MNASGGILKYDSSSLLVFSEGCITLATYPDRLKPVRWLPSSITLWAADFPYSQRVHSHYLAFAAKMPPNRDGSGPPTRDETAPKPFCRSLRMLLIFGPFFTVDSFQPYTGNVPPNIG